MESRLSAPRTKLDFYQRWLKNEFGNRPHAWWSLEDLQRDLASMKSPDALRVSVRSLVPGGQATFRVPASELRNLTLKEGDYILQESMPDDDIIIQGSAFFGLDGEFNVEFSEERGKNFRGVTMRPLQGKRAEHLLKARLDCKGYETVMELCSAYPQAVCEFACFSYCVGIWPNHRTVIFELRAY